MSHLSRPRLTFVRLVSLLSVLALTATSLVAEPGRSRGKSFGHRPETVTLRGNGNGRLTGPNPGRKPADVAGEFASNHREALGVTNRDIAALRSRDETRDRHTGVAHVYMRQHVNGIEVAGADLATHLTGAGEVIAVNSTLVPNVEESASGSVAISATDAAIAVATDLGLVISEPLRTIEPEQGVNRETSMSDGGVASDPIQARLVYQPLASGAVRLAWNIDLQEKSGEHWWNISVDAETGEILAGDDNTDHDNWEGVIPDQKRNAGLARVSRNAAVLRPPANESVNDGSSYNVFPQPFENPNDGSNTQVSNPADSLSSPFGWHDTNGVNGPEFTITRGNNVHAYVDADANNNPDATGTPDGGPFLQFTTAMNPALPPANNRPAAVTNLFYWNNIVHDVFYRYGFDEMSGNFQVNNYGRGPTSGNLGANDDVRAEAQDGSGTNNANFSTGNDGQRPRMQMYVWSYPFPNVVEVAGPSPVAGSYIASGATFGPPITAAGLSGQVIAAIDASNAAGPSTTDGCSAYTNAAEAVGRIVMVDRGTCVFSDKVKVAQDAGAIGVIVVNNTPLDPASMGFTAPIPTITIPSVMIHQSAGAAFRSHVPFDVTIRATPNPPPNRDSDFDAGVIAHEYGHGISNRLTGGRTVTGCLNNNEQMGEGWSDFLGLVLTTHPADTAAQPRGVGTYLIWQNALGNGIRPSPYSTDMTVNPSTYDTIKTAAVPHGVGYTWATMLWEMYWNLVHKHGYNPNVYDTWQTGGNNLAIQLVMDGMKLQPCRPGFVTGRDAILLADVNLTGGANQCEIWKAFAKRGLGIGASQGSSLSVADGSQSFISDDAAPVISNVSVSTATLWPVNSRMIDVAVSYDVADMCGVTKTLTVTSNEPDTSPERGDLAGDWEVVSSNLVRLRAERLGNGTGRMYTITIHVSDGVNTSTQTVTVAVPHDQGRS